MGKAYTLWLAAQECVYDVCVCVCVRVCVCVCVYVTVCVCVCVCKPFRAVRSLLQWLS